MRDPAIRYLHSAGYLTPDEEPDVLVLRPSDLRLVPPAAVVRCLDDAEIWMPTVEGSSPDGPVVGLLTQPTELARDSRRRRDLDLAQPPPSAPDATALLRSLGHEMTIRGRLVNPWALYAADVRPEIWARTEELTETTNRTLSAHLEGGTRLEVPIRRTAAGESVGALRDHEISIFLAGDEDALASSIGRYLVSCGFLRDAADLRPELITAPPTERLDPDSIWTRGDESMLRRDAPEASTELSAREETQPDREVETT
jgi:hypothetical protein